MLRATLLALFLLLGACGTLENLRDGTEMRVAGERLYISGEITSPTAARFERVLAAHPQVALVVPLEMGGSLDDRAVLRMGHLLRDRGLDTHLTGQSRIYSGAVDLFIAGRERTMAPGAVIGVHSWVDGFGEGTDYPPEAPEHRANAAYVRRMLGSEDFYWFTLRAAPSDGIHEMTRAEIARFGLLTEPGMTKE
jgi:hypothetical protein